LLVVLGRCCKKNPLKIPFNEKIKMFKKVPFVVESFIIVGSFDCGCTQQKLEASPKPKGNIEKTHLEQTNCKYQEILQELTKGTTCIIPMKIGGEVPLNTTNKHKQKTNWKTNIKRGGRGMVVMAHKPSVNRIKVGMGCKVRRTNILIKKVL
jgi:hypothetical protein